MRYVISPDTVAMLQFTAHCNNNLLVLSLGLRTWAL